MNTDNETGYWLYLVSSINENYDNALIIDDLQLWNKNIKGIAQSITCFKQKFVLQLYCMTEKISP